MLNLNKFSWRGFDWVLCVAMFLLIALGLTAIYSVDLSRGAELTYFKKQLIATGIGGILFLIASFSQYTLFRSSAKWWFVAATVFLIVVLVFGSTIRGTRGWFSVAGLTFQPVEFAKVGLILMLSYIIARFGRRFDRPLFFFGTGMVTMVLVGLVMLQPDLGSAVLLGLIWFGLMLLAGAKKLYVGLLLGVVLLVGTAGWFFFLQPYQKDRLITFINPEKDPLGAGYNVTQAIIAVGAGKFFGRGLGFGSQSQLKFLPEAQTDFIFSVIGEELGMAGVGVGLLLFGVLFWRLFLIIRKTNDDFVASVAAGVVILFFSQFFINVGANLGLLPVTGVPLPFISYGGSSLMMSMLLLGIAESMAGEN